MLANGESYQKRSAFVYQHQLSFADPHFSLDYQLIMVTLGSPRHGYCKTIVQSGPKFVAYFK